MIYFQSQGAAEKNECKFNLTFGQLCYLLFLLLWSQCYKTVLTVVPSTKPIQRLSLTCEAHSFPAQAGGTSFNNEFSSHCGVESRTGGGAEASTSGINGTTSCRRSAKQFYSHGDSLTLIALTQCCQQAQLSLGSSLAVNNPSCF